MKKMARVMAVAIMVAILLAGCFGGDVSKTQREIGESQLYNKGEISAAMNKVIRFFGKEFDGCTLLELKYNEEYSAAHSDHWAEYYDVDEVIILQATFYVGETGSDGSLEPNRTYKNYEWVLIRKGIFGWNLQSWGYC